MALGGKQTNVLGGELPAQPSNSTSFLVRLLAYAAVLMLDLASGIAFGWHFAVGGAAGAVTAFAWLWVNAR